MQFSTKGYMNSGVMWFVSCQNCSSNATRNDSLPSTYLTNATIGIDSTFYLYGTPIIDTRGDTSIQLFEGYKLMNNWRRKPWGSWSASYRLKPETDMIWERRGDLTGVVLRCASASVKIILFINNHTCNKSKIKTILLIYNYRVHLWLLLKN